MCSIVVAIIWHLGYEIMTVVYYKVILYQSHTPG